MSTHPPAISPTTAPSISRLPAHQLKFISAEDRPAQKPNGDSTRIYRHWVYLHWYPRSVVTQSPTGSGLDTADEDRFAREKREAEDKVHEAEEGGVGCGEGN